MAILEQEIKPNRDRQTGRAIARLIAIQKEGDNGSNQKVTAIRKVICLSGNPTLVEQILKGGV